MGQDIIIMIIIMEHGVIYAVIIARDGGFLKSTMVKTMGNIVVKRVAVKL
jgi:hypothetical protein